MHLLPEITHGVLTSEDARRRWCIQGRASMPDSCKALKNKPVSLSWPTVCPFKPPRCNPFSVQLIHSRLFQLCITHRFVQRHSHKLLVSMLVQPLGFFFFFCSLYMHLRLPDRQRERERRAGREGQHHMWWMPFYGKAVRNVLDFNQNYLFFGGRLVCCLMRPCPLIVWH